MMKEEHFNLLVILGPTASGKTRLAVQLADQLNGEIISADSRQIYQGLDIGSGKDLEEYQLNDHSIPYYLIDEIGLDQEFSVFHFQHLFFDKYLEIINRKKLPVLVGGTGLYLEAALKKTKIIAVPENRALRLQLAKMDEKQLKERLLKFKPKQHNKTNIVNQERMTRAIEIAEYEQTHYPQPAPAITPLILGTRWARTILRERIAERLKNRIEAGLLEEIEGLRENGVSWQRLNSLGLEYRYGAAFLQKQIKSREELFEKLYYAICDFAKRQLAWFRRMERQGYEINWIEEAGLEVARNIIQKVRLRLG